jgi:hypothetical protein
MAVINVAIFAGIALVLWAFGWTDISSGSTFFKNLGHYFMTFLNYKSKK